jgi:hypothetical protein
VSRSLKLRRVVVIIGVIASLVVGVLSIEVAAALTAAAAPPPAPPMSLSALQDALAAQQARGDDLEAQLAEMNDLTAALSAALAGTSDHISTQGKTAKELQKDLKAAQSKLAKLQGLLAKAEERLAVLRQAAKNAGSGGGSAPRATPKPAAGGSTGSTGGGGGGTSTSLSLTLSLSGGGVRVDWSACSVSGFAGYAVVRSLDSEIHFPPEDRDTEVARITSASTTVATDGAAPTGRLTYKVYCLVSRDHEISVAGSSAAKQIQVP